MPNLRVYQSLLTLTWLTALFGIFWGLADTPIGSLNEGRRALPIFEMFHSGNWLVPKLNGEVYLTKPPLMYWLGATFSQGLGEVSELTLRLPSALAALLTCLFCYRFVLTSFGRWPALFSLQVVLANAGLTNYARLAEIEMLLTALCFGALLLIWSHISSEKGYWKLWLSYAVLGLAMLTKGPLVLLFVTLPVLTFAILTKSRRAWQALWNPIAWIIFLAVGLSWYAVLTSQLGLGVWESIVSKDIVDKVSGEQGDHTLSYFLWIFIDFFPYSLIVAPALIWMWRKKVVTGLPPKGIWLACTICIPLLIYSFIAYKNDKYLLPIYPWIAIAMGVVFGVVIPRLSKKLALGFTGILAAMPLAYAVVHVWVAPVVNQDRYTGLLAIKDWVKDRPGEIIYAYKAVDPRTVFYARKVVPVVGEPELAALKASRSSFYLLVDARRHQELFPSHDCTVKEIKPFLRDQRSLIILGYGDSCRR